MLNMKSEWLFMPVFLFGIIISNVNAQGDLLISPNRVVFEGRKQKAELNLINTGTETTTFSVSFVQRKMKDDGSFESIEQPEAGQLFASPYLRVYPRQVTLEPGEAQVVMVQCIRTPDMVDGEYRSHLYFRSEKNYTPLGREPKDTVRTLAVQLIPIFGMSIPVIIRSGDVDVKASLDELKLEMNEEPAISFTILRNGNKSIYGDISVEYVPLQGKPYEIGLVKGVAVYTNINKRFMKIRLNNTTSLGLNKGRLRLRYYSNENYKRPEIFAESELDL